jgi:putative phosphoesterase
MKKNLKIGILSDSHRKTKLHKEAIAHLINSGAEYLLHAGDLEIKEHLNMLKDTGVPYTCVYGNNDTLLIPLYGQDPIYREPHYFDIEGIKIKMMHTPYYLNPDADIVIYGHTHIFQVQIKGDTLFINPGEVLVVPNSYTTRLAQATQEELREYRLIGGGKGIHFPLIDEDISVEGIIRDFGNEVKRVNISLPILLLDEIDSFAKKHHLSRSALLQKATNEYMNLHHF